MTKSILMLWSWSLVWFVAFSPFHGIWWMPPTPRRELGCLYALWMKAFKRHGREGGGGQVCGRQESSITIHGQRGRAHIVWLEIQGFEFRITPWSAPFHCIFYYYFLVEFFLNGQTVIHYIVLHNINYANFPCVSFIFFFMNV